jgi:hypothetical protein
MSTVDFRRAASTGDLDLALSALTDDVVLHSPLTDRVTFTGKADVGALFEIAFAHFDGLDYHTEIGDGDRRVLVGGATAGGQPFEETLLLRLEDDKIAEITLFIRPLPGLTAVMAALGPRLARRNGRGKLVAGALRVMTAPLAAMTKSGDKVGIGLALPKGRVPA